VQQIEEAGMDLELMIFAVKQKDALNEYQHETRHSTHHSATDAEQVP